MNSGRDVLSELSLLVDTLTTSGSQSLDQELFKQVKNICKSSDENVHHLYRLVMSQLGKQHAEIRLSSLQIINEIFSRSHSFRVLLTDNLQEFFVLTIGTDADIPLPEPSKVAKTLKNQTFQAIEKWHEKYGSYYKTLALGYKYLKNVKGFEFDGVRSHTALEREREQAGVARQEHHTDNKLNRLMIEMGETTPEIKGIIIEMGNCFHLVLPSPEEFDIYESSMNEGSNHNFNEASASQGFSQASTSQDSNQASTSKDSNKPSTSQCLKPETQKKSFQGSSSLNITVNTSVVITESKENADVINTLREQHKQITNKYLPVVQKWLDILTKHSGLSQNLVQAIDLKNSLTDLQQKFKSLKIIPVKQPKSNHPAESRDITDENEDSDDETFVDVPEKEGIEHIQVSDRHKYGLGSSRNVSDQSSKDEKIGEKPLVVDTFFWDPRCNTRDPQHLVGDPCSRATAVAAFVQKQKGEPGDNFDESILPTLSEIAKDSPKEMVSKSDEKRAELLKKAPVLPFGMDLYHWGKEEAPSVSNIKSLHCFWVHGNDENDDHCPGDIKESLKSRSIKFTGEFQGIKWACRAPLANGKLCPRRDRHKCPFHGKIVPRNETGEPDGHSCREEQSLNDLNTVQETEQITKDIELATGLNLTGNKSKKGKKRKHGGLANLKKNADTSRSRLEKKVFNKSSLERVAGETDRVKKALIDEKFGNNWNYSLSQ